MLAIGEKKTNGSSRRLAAEMSRRVASGWLVGHDRNEGFGEERSDVEAFLWASVAKDAYVPLAAVEGADYFGGVALVEL